MVNVPPRWAFTAYTELWTTFQEKSFSKKNALKVLSEKFKSRAQAFSNLKRNGWLRIETDISDARKSIYILKNPLNVIKQLGEKS